MTTLDPRPRVRAKIQDADPPDGMEQGEKARLRRAANAAARVGLGPIGELVARELLSAQEFGYRLGELSLIHRVVVEIEKRMAEKESEDGRTSTPRG